MDGQFLQWGMLLEYATFIFIVFTVVEFTKEIKGIKLIPTKYWSALIAVTLMLIVNLHNGTFEYWDIVLYVLNGVLISLNANGLASFNEKKK